jgi:CRISPR-associated protein Csb1
LPDDTCRVLVDSVASQANRHENALVEARAAGLIDFSDVTVNLSGTKAELTSLCATEMPHRLSDAILRDSEIEGVSFARSSVGKRILSATAGDLSALIEASPTTVLYGCWFSQHNLPRPLKIQRSVVSEVWAHNAILGKAVGSRIDPLGIEKVQLYEAPDGDWTALASEAVTDKAKPKHSKKRPSEINHGNIAPAIFDRGITAERVVLNWSMPLAAVRRLRFGGGDRDRAGQAYIVALGVLSRVLDHRAGYSYRSRCDLVSKGPLTFDVLDGDGVAVERVIALDVAQALLKEAEAGMKQARLALHRHIQAKPSKKLIGLIAANAAHQAEYADDGNAA